MAAIPSVTMTVVDPGLGVVGAVANIPAIVGTTSSGTANTVVQVATQKKLKDTFGEGPAVEAASHVLSVAGGPILVVRTATTVAASNSVVTASGGGPAISVSGSAVLDADVRIEIIVGGALGTATFRYSLDTYTGDEESKRTYSSVLTVPAGGTYAIPTLGVTLTFAAGTYVADDYYTFTANCAAANATDIGTAFDALDATALSWRFAAVVTSNNTGDTTAHQGIAATMDTKLAAMETAGKYRRAMISTNMDDADPISVWTGVDYDRILVMHGRARIVSGKPFIGHEKPVVGGVVPTAARAAASLISTDLKRIKSGSLTGVTKIFVDERQDSTGVDDIKVSSMTTILGRTGFFITQGRLKSAAGSDFTVWPRGTVMDVACETAQFVQTGFIGQGVRTNSDGTIDERDALRMEKEVQDQLDAVLLGPKNAEGTPGHASDAVYTIDRTNNVLTTSTIQATVAIRPLTYPDYVTASISFVANTGGTEAVEEEA